MAKYKEKQPLADAMQFSGGESSAVFILKWLEGFNKVKNALWVPSLTSRLKSGEVENLQPEHLIVDVWDDEGPLERYHVRVGEWLVFVPGDFYVMDHQLFTEKFEED